MSIGSLFDIARSGIMVTKAALDVTGNNIANVNTPGYSKQEASLSTAVSSYTSYGYMGRGVDLQDIERRVDNFLEKQLLQENHSIGKYTVLDDMYSAIENSFNEQAGVGLMSVISGYFDAWKDVSANPDTLEQRNVLISKGTELVAKAKQIERNFQDLSRSLGVELPNIIERVNNIASNIAYLNERIAEGEAGTNKQSNDFRDQRGALLTELSQLVKFDTLEDNSGRTTVIIGDRNLVSGSIVHNLSQDITADGKDKLLLDNINITDRITGGRLASIFQMKNSDQIGIPYALTELRKIIGTITNKVNIIHSSGFGISPVASDITVTNKTPDNTTSGNLNSVTLTDFANFTSGEYQIKFTSSTTYDLYRNGSAVSYDNIYTGATMASLASVGGDIAFNGINVHFGYIPSSGDTYYISARNKDFFNDLKPVALIKKSSGMDVSSTSIYDRTSLTYKNYEVRFTDSNNYQLYDIHLQSITGSGSVVGGDTLLIDGMQVKLTGTPNRGDVIKLSPTDAAVTNAGVAIKQTNDVAAASTVLGKYGDNINALAMVTLSLSRQSELTNSTFNTYYNNIVTTEGGFARSAKDNLKFTKNVTQQLQLQRDSVSGVSLDEEAMNLVKFQKGFEAAARLVSVTDEMLKILVNL
ncbi:MAG: flagellar hook-associated protein FlgK [Nitrospirae bacterium YQR-1]